MRELLLNNGKTTLIDKEDYEFLSQYKWRESSYGYAIRDVFNPHHTTRFLHQDLVQTKEGMQLDHINGDKLDNRRDNLREVTPQQNMMNKPVEKGTVSGYKGVTRSNKGGKTWRARIFVEGERIHLGCFKTKEEAAIAYNVAASKYFGEYAWLNKIKGEGNTDDERECV